MKLIIAIVQDEDATKLVSSLMNSLVSSGTYATL